MCLADLKHGVSGGVGEGDAQGASPSPSTSVGQRNAGFGAANVVLKTKGFWGGGQGWEMLTTAPPLSLTATMKGGTRSCTQ